MNETCGHLTMITDPNKGTRWCENHRKDVVGSDCKACPNNTTRREVAK